MYSKHFLPLRELRILFRKIHLHFRFIFKNSTWVFLLISNYLHMISEGLLCNGMARSLFVVVVVEFWLSASVCVYSINIWNRKRERALFHHHHDHHQQQQQNKYPTKRSKFFSVCVCLKYEKKEGGIKVFNKSYIYIVCCYSSSKKLKEIYMNNRGLFIY